MLRINRLTATAALLAAVSMIAAPLSAAELPRPHGPASVQAYDGEANSAEHRRWRRHRGGVDGGDILAGVLILGGIAAVASAVESNNRRERYDYPPPPSRSGRYDYRGSSSGLDRAADICVDAIERTMDPVGSVDSVRRGASGWDIDGTLRDGTPFICTIGNGGEIEDIRVDRDYRGASYDSPYAQDADSDSYYAARSHEGAEGEAYGERPYEDNQWDEETYARLRESRAYGAPGG